MASVLAGETLGAILATIPAIRSRRPARKVERTSAASPRASINAIAAARAGSMALHDVDQCAGKRHRRHFGRPRLDLGESANQRGAVMGDERVGERLLGRKAPIQRADGGAGARGDLRHRRRLIALLGEDGGGGGDDGGDAVAAALTLRLHRQNA